MVSYCIREMGNRKEIADLNKIFNAIDKNGDGIISKEELEKGIKAAAGNTLTKFDINEIMYKIDLDKNGYVDYSGTSILLFYSKSSLLLLMIRKSCLQQIIALFNFSEYRIIEV